MKTHKNNYLKNSVILLILFFVAFSANAQYINCPEVNGDVQNEPTSLLTQIGENDYPYFLNISSLKKYSNIKNAGLFVGSARVKSYMLEAHGRKVKLFATYGKDGNLIKGRLITKNQLLPRMINLYLITDNYKGWTMTSNKTVVNDFDARKTEYQVKIQKGKTKQTLFFDHSGNRINKLSHS